MLLPKKDSQGWFIVFLLVWFVNIVALVISRYQISFDFDYPTSLVFVSISLLVASIASLGWFGLTSFTKTFMFFNIIAIFNMLYITSVHPSDSFSEITSLLNYIFFIAMGTLAGILIEGVKNYFDGKDGSINAIIEKQKPIAKKSTVAKKPAAKKKSTVKKSVAKTATTKKSTTTSKKPTTKKTTTKKK